MEPFKQIIIISLIFMYFQVFFYFPFVFLVAVFQGFIWVIFGNNFQVINAVDESIYGFFVANFLFEKVLQYFEYSFSIVTCLKIFF